MVSIGYADGVPRNGPQREQYVLRAAGADYRAHLHGYMVIDVRIEEAGPGDIVTIIGRDGDDNPVEDIAESCGTITNEILSRLGALPRIITEGLCVYHLF